MTPREYDLQQKLRASQKNLRDANRRYDELFVRLTEAQRQIGVLREANPDAAVFLDMKERAAKLASTAQVIVNHAGKFSRILGKAAHYGQSMIDTAGNAERTTEVRHG